MDTKCALTFWLLETAFKRKYFRVADMECVMWGVWWGVGSGINGRTPPDTARPVRPALAVGHLSNKMCRREAEQKLCHFAVNAARVSEGAEFRVYDQILDKMDTFKYPGQMLSFDEIYWTAVVRNLHRAQSKLGMFSYLLGWDGGWYQDLWEVLCGGGPFFPYFRIRFMGHVDPHYVGVGEPA